MCVLSSVRLGLPVVRAGRFERRPTAASSELGKSCYTIRLFWLQKLPRLTAEHFSANCFDPVDSNLKFATGLVVLQESRA